MDPGHPVLARWQAQVEAARARGGALCIRGGGSKDFYGGERRGEPLDATALAGISSYEPCELVVSARAGTPLADLESALADQGQCLPFQPPRFAPGGTVGGMVAAGLSGPARAAAGAVRDFVLGATLLNGRGELLSFGGQVMKNVAGYDVSRLLAGSLGVLGVICEVSLKVLPLPPATSTLGFDMAAPLALRRLAEWSRRPLPVNAAAWHDGRTFVRLAGAQAAVRAARAELGGEEMPPDQAAAWWNGVRDQAHDFFRLSTAELAAGLCLWRLSLPANRPPLPLPGSPFIEWGGALRWYRGAAAAADMRAAAAAVGGHATLFRGADKSAGVFTPLGAALLRIHGGLKLAFDPDRVFNPGRLYPEL
jgi:FAD/FMN-containing dehydrogenase